MSIWSTSLREATNRLSSTFLLEATRATVRLHDGDRECVKMRMHGLDRLETVPLKETTQPIGCDELMEPCPVRISFPSMNDVPEKRV